MGLSEAEIQNQIRAAVARSQQARTYRNNVGMLRDARGVPVRYGLATGSADLIGLVAPSGRFLSIEVKAPKGRLRPEQEAWLAVVRRFGGVAGVARSVDDALGLIREAQTEDAQRAIRVLRLLRPEALSDDYRAEHSQEGTPSADQAGEVD